MIGVKAVVVDANDDRREFVGGSKSTTNLPYKSQNRTPLPPLLAGGSRSQSSQVAVLIPCQLSTPLLIFLLFSGHRVLHPWLPLNLYPFLLLIHSSSTMIFAYSSILPCYGELPLDFRFDMEHPLQFSLRFHL
ncbi:hypothetical protein KSP40_PGU014060 [Platanthera guangdongensis]|uniref:Uncharacterized protein n=1 Tax=Platanthera guangdongensis TaxID=2320717 RepID=A0ABR2MDJ6_9ASPA